MRLLRFFPVVLVILLSACSKQIIQKGPQDGSSEKGELQIMLSTDLDNREVSTKAEEPLVEDFRIAIYKVANQIRLYNSSYAKTAGKTIGLNAGEYRLVAQHGDSLGCGFNKPYYMADPTFEITSGRTEVEAVAKLANLKLCVTYDASISDNYPDYYAVVKHQTHKTKKLKFSKNETRAGYMPAGQVVLEVYAQVDDAGTWKYFKTDVLNYSPNDFVTFDVTTDARDGNLVLNITVDNTVESKNEVVKIPSYTIPQDAPTVALAGFDEIGNVHLLTEGIEDGTSAMASFVAREGIRSCVLEIDSDFLKDKGVSERVDFTDLDATSAGLLKAAGILWDEEMLGSRKFSYIDFSALIQDMLSTLKATGEDFTLADFTLTVTDDMGDKVTETFSIVSAGINLTLDIKDYNVWARRVESPVVTITRGSTSLVTVQYSEDGGANWNDLDVEPSITGNTLDYGTLPLASNTTYNVRAIYNDNQACVSNVVTFTSEQELQIGNSSFEEYQTVYTEFTPLGGALGGGKYTRTWYLPYASGDSNPWWACNSRQSMPDGHTGWTGTWCKNFPSSGYVKDAYSGSKAAMVYTVNIGDGNTNDTAVGTDYEGELWIGTADSNGNRTSEGRAFESRPSALTFYYKYSPKGSEKFYVYTYIKNAQGQIIARGEVTDGPAADTWTKYRLNYSYSDVTTKAATIYVLFRSCNGNGSVSTKVDFDLGEESVRAHVGSMFKIDALELVYE